MRNQPLHPYTAVINQKQKNISKIQKQQALKWLATRFPHLFDNQSSIKPLKIGIMKDLMAHAKAAEADGISISKLREALVLHTRKIEYLACLKAREMRVDLENNPTTQVTAEEAENAAIKLKRHVEKGSKIYRTQEVQPAIYTPLAEESPARERKVVIKHKAARQLDATAVARLKEKLGLKQQLLKEAK